MRELFDCLVVGSGPAACVVARGLADAGRRVALLAPPSWEGSDWIDYWLVPLDPACEELAQLTGRTLAQWEAAAEQVLEIESRPATTHRQRCALWAMADVRDVFLSAAVEHPGVVYCERARFARFLGSPGKVQGAAASLRGQGVHEYLAPVVIDATRMGVRGEVAATDLGRFDVVAWGRYRGVQRDPGSRAATCLTYRGASGARFWLLPMAGEETHLGVEVDAQSAGRVLSAAQIWEDELVGCPELAERLMAAELLESCQFQRLAYRVATSHATDGRWPLADLDFPTPLGFRWEALAQALALVETIVRGASLSHEVAGK